MADAFSKVGTRNALGSAVAWKLVIALPAVINWPRTSPPGFAPVCKFKYVSPELTNRYGMATVNVCVALLLERVHGLGLLLEQSNTSTPPLTPLNAGPCR